MNKLAVVLFLPYPFLFPCLKTDVHYYARAVFFSSKTCLHVNITVKWKQQVVLYSCSCFGYIFLSAFLTSLVEMKLNNFI